MNNFSELFRFFILFTAKTSLIFSLVLMIHRLLKKFPSSIKYKILGIGILSTLIIPVFYFATPFVQIDLIKQKSSNFLMANQQNPVSDHTIIPPFNLELKVFSSSPVKIPIPQIEIKKPQSYFKYLILFIWLLTAGVINLRILSGFFIIKRFSKNSVRLKKGKALTIINSIQKKFKLRYVPGIKVCTNIASPMTYGIIKHVILLPSVSHSWSFEKLEMVLMHEAAHIKRNDFLFNLLFQIGSSFSWFNPLAWKISRILFNDREGACDDYILRTGDKSINYAQYLLEIAKSLTPQKSTYWTPICMATNTHLEGRIKSILNSKKNRFIRSKRISFLKVILILFVILFAGTQPWIQPLPLQAKSVTTDNFTNKLINKLTKSDFERLRTDFDIKKDYILELNKIGLPPIQIDDLLFLKKTNTSIKYIKAIKQLGQLHLTADEVAFFSSTGLTVEKVIKIRKTQPHLSLGEIADLSTRDAIKFIEKQEAGVDNKTKVLGESKSERKRERFSSRSRSRSSVN